jgi:hypothetical protein
MDVGDEGIEFLLELKIVVGAAEAPLVAELEECDPAHVAAAFVEDGEILGGLSDAERPHKRPAFGSLPLASPGLTRIATVAPLGLIEVDAGMFLAEMDLADIARLEFRDVEHRRVVALLALHGIPARSACPLPGTHRAGEER